MEMTLSSWIVLVLLIYFTVSTESYQACLDDPFPRGSEHTPNDFEGVHVKCQPGLKGFDVDTRKLLVQPKQPEKNTIFYCDEETNTYFRFDGTGQFTHNIVMVCADESITQCNQLSHNEQANMYHGDDADVPVFAWKPKTGSKVHVLYCQFGRWYSHLTDSRLPKEFSQKITSVRPTTLRTTLPSTTAPTSTISSTISATSSFDAKNAIHRPAPNVTNDNPDERNRTSTMRQSPYAPERSRLRPPSGGKERGFFFNLIGETLLVVCVASFAGILIVLPLSIYGLTLLVRQSRRYVVKVVGVAGSVTSAEDIGKENRGKGALEDGSPDYNTTANSVGTLEDVERNLIPVRFTHSSESSTTPLSP